MRKRVTLGDYVVRQLIRIIGCSREMPGELSAALRNDCAERVKSAATPDSVDELAHQGAPEIRFYFLVDAFVTQNPDASLKKGDEYEDTRLILRVMKSLFVEGKDGPVSHRAVCPLMAYQGELQMRHLFEEVPGWKEEQSHRGYVEPDGDVI
jgi:hypothetical protein